MSLITINRVLVSQENSESICNVDEGSESAAESGSKSSHGDDFFLNKTSAFTLSVKSQRRSSVVRDHDKLHEHLKCILQILRFDDYIKLIAKLENAGPYPGWFRYLAIISTVGSQNTEESAIMGIDVFKGVITIGFVLPIYQDIVVELDGDGGFKLITRGSVHLFKPISVQALWAAHHAIMLGCKVALQSGYHSKGPSHTWISYYTNLPSSKPFMMFEWNKMEDIENMGMATTTTVEFIEPVSEVKKRDENLKSAIRFYLQRIMGSVDLEDVNVVQLREMLEDQMGMSLKDQRHFIADQVLIIYGQMDVPSYIFDHLLLGSSFNAFNGDELRRNNVTHIVNVTREVDNFFPIDQFVYKNIRIYDDEKAQILPYWDETFKFINEARANGTRCLVHCKMGISRSGSTVVAYVMKEKGWKLDEALEFVKSKRSCVNPNANFLRQLETYQGILEASAHRHSALFKQNNKPLEAVTGVVRPRTKCLGSEEELDAPEPPLGPSGPVDLEAELFAFKPSAQVLQIQKNSVTFPLPPPVMEDSRSGIRRRVLATTSQRIRHWHPDVYEGVGNGGAVISRSKSSPTPVCWRHQPPTASSVGEANASPPHFAVHLVASSGSLLNSTITIPSHPACASDCGGAEECINSIPSHCSLSSSASATSSVIQHDIIVTPSFFRRVQVSSEGLERASPRSRRVTVGVTPSINDVLESSTTSALSSTADYSQAPSTGRLTFSLFTLAPDEEQPHKPVRTLSLRLRPDDSWIVKRHTGREIDELLKTTSDRQPFAEINLTTSDSITSSEEEEEAVKGRPTLSGAPTTVGSGIPFKNAMPATIAASQQ